LSVGVGTFPDMTEPSHLRATRLAYDTVAADYAETLRSALTAQPYDRALLGIFAELIRAAGGGPVADIGCGPGRITTHLDSLGLDAFGIDLSPSMVTLARRAYPGMRFDEGSMLELDLADGMLAGVVAWYSVIHTPPEQLSIVFAELHRVLRPGGLLLLAFQVGDATPVHVEHAYGHDVSAVAYRLPPSRIAQMLGAAAFFVDATMVREPGDDEKVQQAYLLAMKTESDRANPTRPRRTDR